MPPRAFPTLSLVRLFVFVVGIGFGNWTYCGSASLDSALCAALVGSGIDGHCDLSLVDDWIVVFFFGCYCEVVVAVYNSVRTPG